MSYVVRVGRAAYERYASALSYQDFRNQWYANMWAQAAAWALIVARGLLVFDKTNSAMWVGVTVFAATGPMIFIPPFAGVLADRFDRKRILSWTYSLNLLNNLVMALLIFSGRIEIWQIVLLSFTNGVFRAVQMPVSQALVASLVPRQVLLNALSLNTATQHGSRLLGPGLVTPLIVYFGEGPAFLLCTVFYAIGWVYLQRVKAVSTGGARADESFVENFVDGLRYSFSKPLIRMVLILVFFHCGLTMAFESTMPGFIKDHLPGNRGGFGTLMMGIGLGGLIGSIYVGGIQSSLARGRMFLMLGLLSGLGQIVMAFSSVMVTAFLAAIVMGGAQAGFMTMGNAITQSLASDEYRGRLASINTFSLGGVMSIMNLANGWIATHYGSQAVLLFSGGLFIFIMLLSVLTVTPRRVYRTGIPAEARA